MSFEAGSEGVYYKAFSGQPNTLQELKSVSTSIDEKSHVVVLDFGKVEVLTSDAISVLLELRNRLKVEDKKLFLSRVSFLTKCVFTATGVDVLFDFIQDNNEAFKHIKQ